LGAPLAWVERPEGRARVLKLLRPEQRVALPVLSFVVRHPDAGVLLIDTGLHPEALDDVRKDFGRLPSIVFGGLRAAPPAFDAQLHDRGVDPEAVTPVVMTHLHADHTSGMRVLPSAEFIVTGREWKAATGQRAAFAGYSARHLPDDGRVRRIDFAEAEAFGPFERTIDLLGDGSVRLISTPGHTLGHMSVLLRSADRPVLVVGDAVYRMRNLEEEILPYRTADDDLYRESVRQLRAYAWSNPDALLVPTHDDEAWRAL
jgi:N-acyl homoserine lactone hydrolase